LHEEERLQGWLKLVQEDKNALVTLGGDMFDQFRTKARRHVRSYTADRNSFNIVEEANMKHIEKLAEFLGPVKEKIIGSVSGNHYSDFPDGQISDQKLANLLGDSWCGVAGFIRVNLTTGQQKYPLIIALHHDGGSGARTPGADFNAFHNVAKNIEADIIVMGHTHRLYNVPGATKVCVNEDGHVGAKGTIFVRSGAYLKRYTEEHTDPNEPFNPDYGEERLYPPSTFGHTIVEVTLRKGKPRYTLRTEIN
jgi:predicted phosphodiesterase